MDRLRGWLSSLLERESLRSPLVLAGVAAAAVGVGVYIYNRRSQPQENEALEGGDLGIADAGQPSAPSISPAVPAPALSPPPTASRRAVASPAPVLGSPAVSSAATNASAAIAAAATPAPPAESAGEESQGDEDSGEEDDEVPRSAALEAAIVLSRGMLTPAVERIEAFSTSLTRAEVATLVCLCLVLLALQAASAVLFFDLQDSPLASPLGWSSLGAVLALAVHPVSSSGGGVGAGARSSLHNRLQESPIGAPAAGSRHAAAIAPAASAAASIAASVAEEWVPMKPHAHLSASGGASGGGHGGAGAGAGAGAGHEQEEEQEEPQQHVFTPAKPPAIVRRPVSGSGAPASAAATAASSSSAAAATAVAAPASLAAASRSLVQLADEAEAGSAPAALDTDAHLEPTPLPSAASAAAVNAGTASVTGTASEPAVSEAGTAVAEPQTPRARGGAGGPSPASQAAQDGIGGEGETEGAGSEVSSLVDRELDVKAVARATNALLRVIDAAHGAALYDSIDGWCMQGIAEARASDAAGLLALATRARASLPPAIQGEADRTPANSEALIPPEGYTETTRPLAALLWRWGRNGNTRASARERALRNEAASGGSGAAAAAEEVRQQYATALSHVEESLGLWEQDADAHKYASILLARVPKDTKEKIANGHRIREHAARGLALRPKDPVLHHILGVWCYEVASLTWLKRQVATALFGAPPTATYSEALEHLTKAEELAEESARRGSGSGPWMTNRLKLGQVCEAMGLKDAAKEWLYRAAALPVSAGEDAEAVKQAQELAGKLGIKFVPAPAAAATAAAAAATSGGATAAASTPVATAASKQQQQQQAGSTLRQRRH